MTNIPHIYNKGSPAECDWPAGWLLGWAGLLSTAQIPGAAWPAQWGQSGPGRLIRCGPLASPDMGERGECGQARYPAQPPAHSLVT